LPNFNLRQNLPFKLHPAGLGPDINPNWGQGDKLMSMICVRHVNLLIDAVMRMSAKIRKGR